MLQKLIVSRKPRQEKLKKKNKKFRKYMRRKNKF